MADQNNGAGGNNSNGNGGNNGSGQGYWNGGQGPYSQGPGNGGRGPYSQGPGNGGKSPFRFDKGGKGPTPFNFKPGKGGPTDLGGSLKKFGRYLLIVVIVIFVFTTVSGGFYNVSEQENAVVTMFGKVIQTNTAGLYFKIPYIQQVRMVDMTTHGIGIGYSVDGNGQNFTVEDEGIMITSDFNFVDIDFYLEYKVSDPVQYLYNSRQPEVILKNTALACIRSTVSDFPVDDVITTGKSQIQQDVREKLVAELEEQQIGLQLVNIQIQDAEPPTREIVQAFKSVETAKQGKETSLNNANKYRNEQIPAAEAEADKIVQAAEAAKQTRIAEAEGQVERFNQMFRQYELYPLITKQRLYYEAIEEALPGTKVIITDGTTQEVLPIESFTGTSQGTSNNQYSQPTGSDQ